MTRKQTQPKKKTARRYLTSAELLAIRDEHRDYTRQAEEQRRIEWEHNQKCPTDAGLWK